MEKKKKVLHIGKRRWRPPFVDQKIKPVLNYYPWDFSQIMIAKQVKGEVKKAKGWVKKTWMEVLQKQNGY